MCAALERIKPWARNRPRCMRSLARGNGCLREGPSETQQIRGLVSSTDALRHTLSGLTGPADALLGLWGSKLT